ncbi:hypothetical protein GCM10023201_02500 [Actinomycetospora corticicola]|uniref:Uncharacterized protein n=1 Tax=Actinomycetospora corticicola TaxID=663602 RepID=A0A7Y9E2H5_9PSEU|nr:hypothetical protein [Actinomycetospora corticicola]NYD39914.1 hypothetical protein [Actinomycetospora corticicola]
MSRADAWGLGEGPLPARPDPATGLPRPPAAPRWTITASTVHGTLHLAVDDTPPDGVRPPPPGYGPVLEVQRGTDYDSLVFVGLLAGLLGVGALVDVRVLGFWWLWAVFGVLAVLGVRGIRRTYLAAGADYLQNGRIHVDLYTLTEIVVGVGQGQHWVTLVDRDEHRTTAPTGALHANPELWDLVYNGIRHSVADGARVRGTGAGYLRPRPP